MGYVGFRFSKRTGKVVEILTNEYGNAQMRLWYLQKVTPSQEAVIINSVNGNVIYRVVGVKCGFPEVENERQLDGFTCEKIGIPLKVVQEMFGGANNE